MPRRRLRPAEVREAEEVFGPALPYPRVWIHERSRWPSWLAAVGAALTGRSAPSGDNAVTLGRSVYLPRTLRTGPADLDARLFGDMAWLIHELTHVWQFGHGGYRYALAAVIGQLRLGSAVYRYGGEQGLAEAAGRPARWSDFNPEQQGDIVRDYYLRRKAGACVAAWEPFLAEVRAG